jgi:hypothetical protein
LRVVGLRAAGFEAVDLEALAFFVLLDVFCVVVAMKFVPLSCAD